MKAERRHELQTNSLWLWLRLRLPEIWKEHGTKILLGLIAIAALILIIRWRINAPNQAFAQAQDVLGQADVRLMNIKHGADTIHDAAALQLVKKSELPALVKQAMDASDKPLIQARGYNLLGDYYYELAIWRISDDAATRPYGTDISSKQLDEAWGYYEKALAAKADQPDLSAHAHIGLGTIAYTRAFTAALKASNSGTGQIGVWSSNAQWKVAIDQFQAVIDDPKVPTALKDNAKAQLELVTRMQQDPVQVPKPGEAPPPLEIPTTTPATTEPAPTTTPAISQPTPTTTPATTTTAPIR